MKKEIIHFENISRFYYVGSETVKAMVDVSVSIYENEFVALMGPSGSGKSTMMNILGCLDTATGGSYHLNGTDVSKMTDNELADIRNKEIGFIFQTFNLLTLEQVQLSDRMTHRPNELSGGQRQRVAIARALVNSPSIVLADEPTGNLDSTTSIEIMGLLEEIHKQGNTIVVVTHEEDIALMMDGRIASDEINPNIKTIKDYAISAD